MKIKQKINMKTVMCFGTFDILHLGHLSYLQQARKHGDYLIIVIARDKTKKRMKKEVVFPENERLELVRSLRPVDEAVLGDKSDHLKIIEKKKPDVICLGYDHNVDIKILKNILAEKKLFPKIIRMKAYQSWKLKSSLLKEKIKFLLS